MEKTDVSHRFNVDFRLDNKVALITGGGERHRKGSSAALC